MHYERTLEDRRLALSAEFPALLLTGPRQVGKTTLLRHLLDGAQRRYVALDDPVARTVAAEDPALFLQRHAPPVLIDEIQYAPGLLPLIRIAIDQGGRAGDFWLTGAQQFHMMRGITETLAGRVALVNLLGFSQREAHRAAHQELPFLPEPERLAGMEPIEGLVTKPMASAIFETFVMTKILKSWWHRAQPTHLYDSRDRDKREVDLLIEHAGRLHPLEIKRSASPRRDWVQPFGYLERLGLPLSSGGVVCLAPDISPLDSEHLAIPVGMI